MRFSVWPAAHRPWEDVLELGLAVERLGYDGLWLADHFMSDGPDRDAPVNEAWTLLAALAARVPRLRLGTLVTGNTYRHPAVLAKMAAGVDRVSGGRLVLGLGAAWQESEHRAYGIPFPSLRERLERLDEACHVLRGLLSPSEARTSFEGRHYRLDDAPLAPGPVQERVPLLIGGGGERVTLRIAARHADEWNTWGTPEVMRAKGAVLDRHAESLGRDPAAVERCAVALLFLCDDEATARKHRGGRLARISGTPAMLRDTLAAYAEAGVSELVVPDFTLGSGRERLEALERFLREVAADFRAP